MIKYICLTTQKCNFVIARVETRPRLDFNGNVMEFEILFDRRAMRPNITNIPYSKPTNQTFDTYEEAVDFAKSQFQKEKDKHISNINSMISFQQKRLDKMISYQPKIKRLYLIKD